MATSFTNKNSAGSPFIKCLVVRSPPVDYTIISGFRTRRVQPILHSMLPYKLLAQLCIFPFVLVTASSIYAASFTTSSFLPSASISGASPTAGVITIPLSSYSFTPYPTTPSLAPHPPAFPATDPLNPPDVSSDGHVVHDFAPAWATAYQKARNLISASVLTLDHLYFDY